MQNIIKIHNQNNEMAWQEILRWEALHSKCVKSACYLNELKDKPVMLERGTDSCNPFFCVLGSVHAVHLWFVLGVKQRS